MELIFLGTSAGVPTRTRNVTAILLNLQHPTQSGLWLFDCGEGTQHQLLHTAFSQVKCGIAGAGIAENSERFTWHWSG